MKIDKKTAIEYVRARFNTDIEVTGSSLRDIDGRETVLVWFYNPEMHGVPDVFYVWIDNNRIVGNYAIY